MSAAVLDAGRALYEGSPALDGPPVKPRVLDGADWFLNGDPDTAALWGEGDRVAAAEGEPTAIVAPEGAGKTTLLLHMAFGLVGIIPVVLDLPVRPARGRVGLVAADRPRQIRRRGRMLIGEDERTILADRLIVRPGTLPFDPLRDPGALARFATDELGCSDLLLDSLGALVPGLEKPEVGQGIRLAFDRVIEAGVDLIFTHHPRKMTSEGREPRTHDDVFGSRWITAGCGSVISLWGQPGAPIVSFRHLKQPAGEVGPFRVEVGRDGWMEILRGTNLDGLLLRPGGVSARDVAAALYESTRPSRADVERARRALESAEAARSAVVVNPDRGRTEAARWGRATGPTWSEGLPL